LPVRSERAATAGEVGPFVPVEPEPAQVGEQSLLGAGDDARSSTRITKAPPAARASSQASSAVRALPRCMAPVGLGA
jgi:hypothetical protein